MNQDPNAIQFHKFFNDDESYKPFSSTDFDHYSQNLVSEIPINDYNGPIWDINPMLDDITYNQDFITNGHEPIFDRISFQSSYLSLQENSESSTSVLGENLSKTSVTEKNKEKGEKVRKNISFKKTNFIKGQWTIQEDRELVHLVKNHGTKKWSEIAKMLKGRVGKQCRERWHNHLRPEIKKCVWTEEEDEILIESHMEVGNKWAEIALSLPGRTENAIKNHWNAAKRRLFSKNNQRVYSTDNSLMNYIRSIFFNNNNNNNHQISFQFPPNLNANFEASLEISENKNGVQNLEFGKEDCKCFNDGMMNMDLNVGIQRFEDNNDFAAKFDDSPFQFPPNLEANLGANLEANLDANLEISISEDKNGVQSLEIGQEDCKCFNNGVLNMNFNVGIQRFEDNDENSFQFPLNLETNLDANLEANLEISNSDNKNRIQSLEFGQEDCKCFNDGMMNMDLNVGIQRCEENVENSFEFPPNLEISENKNETFSEGMMNMDLNVGMMNMDLNVGIQIFEDNNDSAAATTTSDYVPMYSSSSSIYGSDDLLDELDHEGMMELLDRVEDDTQLCDFICK